VERSTGSHSNRLGDGFTLYESPVLPIEDIPTTILCPTVARIVFVMLKGISVIVAEFLALFDIS
jgi:hypothetical protein